MLRTIGRAGVMLAATGLLALAAPALAVPVYGTDASGELTGFREVDGNGLTGFNDYSTDFRVDWVIDFDTTTPGLWHYKYTFTGLDGSGIEKEISHIVVDLSADCFDETGALVDDGCVTNAVLTDGDFVKDLIDGTTVLSDCGDDGETNCVEFGSGGLNGIISAIKFDIGGGEGVMYEFDSNRNPVYGHLGVKDGGGSGDCSVAPNVGDTNVVCNNGLLPGADTGNTIDYIARPNGVIPEPGTLPLVAGGLAMWGLARAGRKRRA